MNIQAEKLGLIEWIAKLNDSSVIEKLKKIHEEDLQTSSGWTEISEFEKESIERGLKDIEEGKVGAHDTARKIYERYL
ncbi:hypothetical protein [Carboxylicivirga sp. N1Y90]|uniref:hypothetical protein n=1 Tax=Carboxylicivirga fragile TaxID=3417571 RepID=UPI003D3597EA|nr:hypothetical protein [Marinilabiliaceae bacterium N1Y90]